MKPIIGLTGKLLSGKSEVVKYLSSKLRAKNYSTKIVKQAQPLYEMQDFIYKRTGRTPPIKDRKLLQFLGTKWGRAINPNMWVDLWEMDVKTLRMFNNIGVILCDDVRFNNEAMRIRRMGGVVLKIEADDSVRAKRGDMSGDTDVSELGILPELITATIYNNGSVDDLHKNLDYLFETLDS